MLVKIFSLSFGLTRSGRVRILSGRFGSGQNRFGSVRVTGHSGQNYFGSGRVGLAKNRVGSGRISGQPDPMLSLNLDAV